MGNWLPPAFKPSLRDDVESFHTDAVNVKMTDEALKLQCFEPTVEFEQEMPRAPLHSACSLQRFGAVWDEDLTNREEVVVSDNSAQGREINGNNNAQGNVDSDNNKAQGVVINKNRSAQRGVVNDSNHTQRDKDSDNNKAQGGVNHENKNAPGGVVNIEGGVINGSNHTQRDKDSDNNKAQGGVINKNKNAPGGVVNIEGGVVNDNNDALENACRGQSKDRAEGGAVPSTIAADRSYAVSAEIPACRLPTAEQKRALWGRREAETPDAHNPAIRKSPAQPRAAVEPCGFSSALHNPQSQSAETGPGSEWTTARGGGGGSVTSEDSPVRPGNIISGCPRPAQSQDSVVRSPSYTMVVRAGYALVEPTCIVYDTGGSDAARARFCPYEDINGPHSPAPTRSQRSHSPCSLLSGTTQQASPLPEMYNVHQNDDLSTRLTGDPVAAAKEKAVLVGADASVRVHGQTQCCTVYEHVPNASRRQVVYWRQREDAGRAAQTPEPGRNHSGLDGHVQKSLRTTCRASGKAADCEGQQYRDVDKTERPLYKGCCHGLIQCLKKRWVAKSRAERVLIIIILILLVAIVVFFAIVIFSDGTGANRNVSKLVYQNGTFHLVVNE